MSFSDALRFPFRGEKRWQNIGLSLVCFLIPIVGPIVLIGYGVGVEKAVIRDIDAGAPTFDFGQFMEYLKRGVPPFVVNLILVPILLVIILPVVFGIIMLSALAAHHPWLQILLIASAVMIELGMIVIAIVVLMPLTLKAGLEQTIGGAFDWRFASSFLRHVGLLALGYQLLLMFFSVVGGPFSLCLFIVGAYAFTAYLMLVQFHVQAQLYRTHIARGGVPLAIDAVVPTGFPVAPDAPPAPPLP